MNITKKATIIVKSLPFAVVLELLCGKSYGDYAYKIPNKFISINRSEKAIVFHLPKDYVVRLKNGRTNQTAELTVTEFVAEVAGKDESAYGTKIIRPSQTANGGNTPKKRKHISIQSNKIYTGIRNVLRSVPFL